MHFRSITLFFCLPLLLLTALSSSAQTNSTVHNRGTWIGIALTNPLVKDSRWSYEVWMQERFLHTSDSSSQFITNIGLLYKVSSKLRLGAAYRFINNNGAARDENRTNQSMSLRFPLGTSPFTLNTRTMVEERFREGESEVAFRFRQRVGLNYKVNSKLNLFLTEEVFLPINLPSWVSQHRFDQNRVFVGFRVPIYKRVSLSIGYLNQYLIRDPSNIMNHILVTILNL